MSNKDERDFEQWLERERRDLERADDRLQARPRPSRPRQDTRQARTGRPAPRRAPARRAAPSAGTRWLRLLIPIAVLLTVMVIALAVGFTYASRVARLDTIYPNVTVNGVAVGGMTMEEAAAALGEPADKYSNAAVTVDFPTGDSVTVTAQDLGLHPADGAAVARQAYAYGRGGSMLSNLRTYLACKSEATNMAVRSTETQTIDEAAIAAKLTPVAEQVDRALSVVQAEIREDEITVVKNPGTARVDVAALSAAVREAFEAEKYDPIVYQVPEAADGQTQGTDVDALLRELYERVYVQPVDAQYDQATGGTTQGVQGVRFDMDEAKRLWDRAATGETVTIPLIREDPAVTAEQLEGKLFADVLSEKSTTLAGSTSARINNITLAAAAMNGVVLQPGQEFDYNACLGQRTEAKGYQSAGAFSGGQHVMSIGGGICQGSSTLYYCALKANLTITVRWCHQFLVGYLPRGMDATVSWGWPDFKFVNSRNYPIKIEAWVSGGYLTVRILGTDEDGTYVEITNETWEDASHYYAQTYRNVYDRNGNLLTSNKEAYSTYDKEEALATPTPAPVTTEPPAAPPVVVDPGPVVTEPEPQQPEAPPEAAPIPETFE